MLSGLSLQVLFDAAADAMLLVDDTGHVVHANASALQMFDYVENEIVGLDVEALMPSLHRQSHQQYREKYFNRPEKRPMGKGKNLVALRRDGRKLPVDIGLSPIQTQGQRFVLVTFHVTEKQAQVEESLRTNEERLRLAKLAAGLGIFDYDVKSGVLVCDERVREIEGLAIGDNMTIEQYVSRMHPQERPVAQATLDRATNPNGDGVYKLEYRLKSPPSGTERWVSSVGKVYFEDGEAVRMLGVVQDITEHKMLEKKLQAQRVEMESLAKQQVAIQTASAIAHEINQPLAAISAYSEVALFALGAGDLDTDRLRRSLEGCVTQSQRAGKSLHELLEFLQKGEVTLVPIDLNKVIQKALSITQHNGYGGFHATLDLEPDLPHVLANPLQLQKVLVNILRNGIEAVHNAGVPIAAINVMVRTQADSNMAQVTIQDNGPGLSNETAKRIFEPFFTTKSKGIGMGLAVSRALVEANGGQLWFDPESSTGATFHFTLPLAGT